MKQSNPKDWKSIVVYFIPIIALVIANVFQIADVAEVESVVTAIVTAVLSAVAGVMALVGVIKNNDKNKGA